MCASFDPSSSSLPRGLARTLAAVPCGQLATPPAASNVTSRRCRCCCCRRRRPVPQLASLSVSQGLGVSDRLLLLRPPFVLATGVSLRKLPSFRKRLAPTLLLSMLPPHPADLARAASASGRRTSALRPPVRLRPPFPLSALAPAASPPPPSCVCGGDRAPRAAALGGGCGLPGGPTTRSRPQTAPRLGRFASRRPTCQARLRSSSVPQTTPCHSAYPLGGPCPRASQVLARAQAGRDP